MDGISNLSILWLLSLLPSQLSSSTLRNAEASLKNEELYAGTRKQSVTVHLVWSYLGKLTQKEKHPVQITTTKKSMDAASQRNKIMLHCGFTFRMVSSRVMTSLCDYRK